MIGDAGLSFRAVFRCSPEAGSAWAMRWGLCSFPIPATDWPGMRAVT